MSYSLIIPTMSYSWTFQLCLESLLKSDYPGQIIVVEEGNSHRTICKDYLPKSITYIKSDEFSGPNNLVELALEKAKGDRIIYSHNDVIYFPTWFSEFKSKIERIDPTYFGMLGANYDQVLITEECKTLEELRAKITPQNTVFKTHLYGETDIGLANDLWSNNRVARMSVVATFLKEDCESVLPFIKGVGFEWQLHNLYGGIGKLNLHTMLSQPILHINNEFGFGTDTQFYKQKYLDLREESYKEFKERYGTDVNAFFDRYFGEVQFGYKKVLSLYLDEGNFEEASVCIDRLSVSMGEILSGN